ncbi:MAG: sensor domain-containing diguanylate cyclase [Thermodesulfobacteriota bacterium]|nr:sensor domain-containing diguanylate cyclase [Thermodesulfobacteriota bacterium]
METKTTPDVDQLETEIESKEKSFHEIKRLSHLYQELYEQTADLKHIIYTSISLSGLKSSSVLMSKHIKELTGVSDNSIWLTPDRQTAQETARNGKLIDPGPGQRLDIESSETLQHILKQQRVVWSDETYDLFPDFTAPSLFPIKRKSRVFGFFIVDKVPDDKQDLLQFISEFFGMIFSMSCLHQEVLDQKKELSEMTELLFEQNARMTTLYNMGFEISKCLDTEQLCHHVTETTVKELGAKKAAVFIMDKSTGQLAGASGSGELAEIEKLRFDCNRSDAMWQAMESGRVVSHNESAPELVLGPNCIKEWIIVPIKAAQVSLGVIVAEIDKKDISDPISIMANQAGLMLEKLMAMEELSCSNEVLEKLSTIDCLTGLYNHRYFQERLKEEFSRTQRQGRALTLLVIDLDLFKTVNDNYGHAVGDQVLKEVAKRAGNTLRDVDIAARYGGEEFAVILPDTSRESAMIVAERIRLEICNTPVLSGKESIRTSVSIGVAGFPAPGIESREDLFVLADQVLYSAKKAGRNQVMAAPEKNKTNSDHLNSTNTGEIS